MPGPKLSPTEVRRAAARLPRVRLAHLPTPLEEAPRFAEKLGGGVRVLIKRDDCTGLLLGGNKARHNEFLLGDAVVFCLHQWGRGKDTGIDVESRTWQVMTFRDGKVVHCRGYETKGEALAAAGAG